MLIRIYIYKKNCLPGKTAQWSCKPRKVNNYTLNGQDVFCPASGFLIKTMKTKGLKQRGIIGVAVFITKKRKKR